MLALCLQADLCRLPDSHVAPLAESGNEEVAAAAGRMLTSVIFSAASTQGGVIKTRWGTSDGNNLMWTGAPRPWPEGHNPALNCR